MSRVAPGHNSRMRNLDPSLPDGSHSGIAILSALTSVTLSGMCARTCSSGRVRRVHAYVNVTPRGLPIHASLSKAQAIWCPLSERFYLAFPDKAPAMPRVGGPGSRCQGRVTCVAGCSMRLIVISTCYVRLGCQIIFTYVILRRTSLKTFCNFILTCIKSCALLPNVHRQLQ